jgi:hypothetical protein
MMGGPLIISEKGVAVTTRHHHHGPSSTGTRGLPVSERTPDAPLAALLSCVTVVCLATVSDHHWAWLL